MPPVRRSQRREEIEKAMVREKKLREEYTEICFSLGDLLNGRYFRKDYPVGEHICGRTHVVQHHQVWKGTPCHCLVQIDEGLMKCIRPLSYAFRVSMFNYTMEAFILFVRHSLLKNELFFTHNIATMFSYSVLRWIISKQLVLDPLAYLPKLMQQVEMHLCEYWDMTEDDLELLHSFSNTTVVVVPPKEN